MSTSVIRTQVSCVERRCLLILVVALVASPACSGQVPAPAPAVQPPAAKSQKLELRGTVVDDDGRPVARATVRGAFLTSGGAGARSSGPIPHCLTDGEGRFTLEVPVNVPGTVVHLCARHGHAFMATPAKLTGAALVQPITLRISPKYARAVSVRVLDEDRKPVPGAVITPVLHHHFLLVQAEASAPNGTADKERWVTDAQGRFESPKHLEPIGSYQLELRAAGFYAETTAAKLALESDAAVLAFADVVLKRIRSVEGKVVDRQGRPVAGARIVQADGRQWVEGNTDAEGRFKLDTAFFPPAFLFVEKAGFRFHGQRSEQPGSVTVTLVRRDEPVSQALKTLSPALPREQRRAIAAQVLDPYLKRVLETAKGDDRLRPLEALAKLDAGRLLEELEKRPVKGGGYDSYLRRAAAKALLVESFDEARSIVDSMKDPDIFCTMAYLDLCDALPAQKRAEKLALVNEALLRSRGIKSNDHRVIQLGAIARRLWKVGEKERATKLLRQGQVIAKELPTAAWAGYARGAFAEDLGLIDVPAALELMKDLKDPHEYVRHHGNLAQKLAETNPAEAKRVFEILINLSDRHQAVYRDYYAQRVSYGLAAHDLAGARQIAETINRPYPKPPANNASADTRPQPIRLPYMKARTYALMAEALAGSSPKEALVLLDRAFDLLAAEAASGQDSLAFGYDASTLGGLMLPAAERIDPTLVPEFLSRSMFLRTPVNAARTGLPVSADLPTISGPLALILARYDRELAKSLIQEAAKTQRGIGNPRANYITATALADPHSVVALVAKLPDAAGPSQDYLRQSVAELLLAEGDEVWRLVHRAVGQWFVGDEDL